MGCVKPRFALCDVAQKQPVGFSPRTSASRSRCLERLGQQSPGCSQQVDGTQPPDSKMNSSCQRFGAKMEKMNIWNT